MHIQSTIEFRSGEKFISLLKNTYVERNKRNCYPLVFQGYLLRRTRARPPRVGAVGRNSHYLFVTCNSAVQ